MHTEKTASEKIGQNRMNPVDPRSVKERLVGAKKVNLLGGNA